MKLFSFIFFIDDSVRVNFEFLDKFGVSKWCFHDREIAPDGKTFEVTKRVVFSSLLVIFFTQL